MTTDIDALVERLGVPWERLPNADCAAKKINTILRQRKEAAQALTRLSEENARLREALTRIEENDSDGLHMYTPQAMQSIARAALQGDA